MFPNSDFHPTPRIMASLNRLKTIIQEKRPRAMEFLQDYDKLRHGRVTAE